MKSKPITAAAEAAEEMSESPAERKREAVAEKKKKKSVGETFYPKREIEKK